MNNRYFDQFRVIGICCKNSNKIGVVALICAIFLLTACSGGGGGGSSPPPPATHTISGTVFAAAGNVIDSDVNDLNTTPVSNNDFDTAQEITSPAVVGGYVNVAGSGSAGNSRTAGDTSDYFQVTLTDGESVRLSLPSSAAADIELHLYDSSRAIAASLIGVERMGLLPITADDTYFLKVLADAGASSYKLIVGDAAALTVASSGLNLSSEFVPGQAIVRWKAGAAPAVTHGRLAMTTAASVGGNRFHLMQFDTQEQVGAVFERLNLGAARMAARAMPDADAQMQRKYDTLKIIQALRLRDDVEIAEPNYIRHARLTPTDPLFNQQWHYNAISLPGVLPGEGAWDITTGDPNVIVAVIDTGVLIEHPDLENQLVSGYDFISDPTTANDNDGRDADPNDPGDGLNNNSSFHGTHVAGTIVAEMNNVGGTGVAPTAKVMPVRVLGVGGGTDVDIIAGILFAAGRNNQTSGVDTLPDQPADIINMSLGGPAPSSALDEAILQARGEGVIIVASAGNSSSSQPEYPAASPGVISVAATDFTNQRTIYTNYGTSVDVAAPGGDTSVNLDGIGDDDGVLSTGGSDANGTIVDNYFSAQGTSMSSPHMAGVAALMKSERAGLTPDEMDAYLASGTITDDMNDSGMGAGLINAGEAVNQAGSGPPTTILQASPNALNFETASSTAVLTLAKLGSGALSVTSVNNDAAWLTVSEQTVDADKLGDYSVVVDRTGLSGGIYTATISIESSNNIQMPVRMEVMPDADADAGFQYILLVNATTRTLVEKMPMTFSGGTYSFSFVDIEAGSYYLFTGTDLDNDGYSLDEGEAFGAYPTVAQYAAFTFNSDVQGITFTSGFSLDPFFDVNQLPME